MKSNQYDASSSALGYIYQIRYALLASLRKMQDVDDPDLYYVSIEKLDDIAFEKEGTPEELLQLKYHGTPANLTDKSPDIWKTLRIWAEAIKNDEDNFKNSSFYLITTESAEEKSLAYFLSIDDSKRNCNEALAKILDILKDTPSKENIKGFKAVSLLSVTQQKLLLKNIYVIDKIYDIKTAKENLNLFLKISVNKEYLDAFVQRLEGLWFNYVIKNLNNEVDRICLGELRGIMDDLRDQFLPSNLPNDYSEYSLNDFNFTNEERMFIEQIKLFTSSDKILKTALENYYKAYAQKVRWQSDGLLKPNEIGKYYKRLYREWEEYSATEELSFDFSEEKNKSEFAIKVYQFCQREGAIPIRNMFDDKFVARGSYHQLADELKLKVANDEKVA